MALTVSPSAQPSVGRARPLASEPPAWVADLHRVEPNPLQTWFDRLVVTVAIGVIVLLSLIFLFVTKEALPVILGQVDNSVTTDPVSVEQARTLSDAELARYLGQDTVDVTSLRASDPELVDELVRLRAQQVKKIDPVLTGLNTVSWPMLVLPFQWPDYDGPVFIWQPTSNVPKFNLIPLLVGSLKVTLIALLFAVPLAVGSALYVSQFAPTMVREVVKPVIEMLAGFPTIVLGFFGLLILATHFKDVFGFENRLNAFVTGFVVALAVIPLIFTIAEDAITAVPRMHKETAIALGASDWEAAVGIVMPLALPGIGAAVLLGFGRAIGEMMIPLMVSGNAAMLTAWPFDPVRTVPATIGAELAEAPAGSEHYQVVFLLGALLFAVCFIVNALGFWVITKLKDRLHARTAPEIMPEALNGGGPL